MDDRPYALKYRFHSPEDGDRFIYVASEESPNRWTSSLDRALIVENEDQDGYWGDQYVHEPVVLTSEGWEKIHE